MAKDVSILGFAGSLRRHSYNKAIMGASIGMLGTSRAQYHLRQCFVWLNMHPLNKPEVMVSPAQDKVDQDGNITDGKTRGEIAEMVTALAEWSRKMAFKKVTFMNYFFCKFA